MTRWVRAGLVAAAFSGAPSTVVGVVRGQDLLGSTAAVGSVVLPATASRLSRVAAGGALHLVISLVWARVIAAVLGSCLRPTSSARDRVLGGAACGVAIAALDLGVIGRCLPEIRALPTAPQVADHVAYGALVGWALNEPS